MTTRRVRVAMTAAAATALLACSIPASPDSDGDGILTSTPSSPGPSVASPASPTAPDSTAGAPPRFAPAVSEPLDARGIAPCDLLTPAQLEELGLRPDSAKPGTAGPALICTWSSADDAANPAGIQINTDTTIPALDGIHLVRDTFAVFEPIEVAGHPAIHADRNAGPVCTIYTAIADHQGIATDGNLGGRPLPDPCAPSRRMAELILSNLPPLR